MNQDNTIGGTNVPVAGSHVTFDEARSSLEALFEANRDGSVFGGANQLENTAQLTRISTDLANKVMMVVNTDAEKYEGRVQASMQSHDQMDDLIAECVPLDEIDVDFLRTVSEDEIEKMIRSQQSKRSRSKSKTMTRENYVTMMVGAVAENLLRIASGKSKSTGGGASMGELGYTEEELEELANDPELLKKAIRNVQSKKSIMKSKADYSETSLRWLQLLATEEQLKNIRDQGSVIINEETKRALEATKHAGELLSTVDTENLSEEDAKRMLDSLKEMLASK